MITDSPSRFTSMSQLDGGGYGTREVKTEKVYDPHTGTWKDSSSPIEKPSTPSTSNTSNSDTSSTPSNNVDSQTSAEKEYIEVEFNTLVGDLDVTSTEKSIRIKVNDTIKLEGVGNYLSGLYYVSSVRRTITKDGGYSHVFGLIKNGFGSSVKKAPEAPAEEPRKEEVPKTSPEIKVGDPVKIVGDGAVYSNAHDGVKVPAWVKKKTHTVDAVSSDGTRVRLKEIWSWTYLKFIQKA